MYKSVAITMFVFQCFVFHLYKGVRAGGGIGDEIEPPDGDPNEVYRILFDITFFFFVIIILLAIIQGNSIHHTTSGNSNCYNIFLKVSLNLKMYYLGVDRRYGYFSNPITGFL